MNLWIRDIDTHQLSSRTYTQLPALKITNESINFGIGIITSLDKMKKSKNQPKIKGFWNNWNWWFFSFWVWAFFFFSSKNHTTLVYCICVSYFQLFEVHKINLNACLFFPLIENFMLHVGRISYFSFQAFLLNTLLNMVILRVCNQI